MLALKMTSMQHLCPYAQPPACSVSTTQLLFTKTMDDKLLVGLPTTTTVKLSSRALTNNRARKSMHMLLSKEHRACSGIKQLALVLWQALSQGSNRKGVASLYASVPSVAFNFRCTCRGMNMAHCEACCLPSELILLCHTHTYNQHEWHGSIYTSLV